MMNGKILHQAVQSLVGPLHKSVQTPSKAAAGPGDLKASIPLPPTSRYLGKWSRRGGERKGNAQYISSNDSCAAKKNFLPI